MEDKIGIDLEYENYFSLLTSKSTSNLMKEPERLKRKREEMNLEMDNLAINNYKSFISSYSCIRDTKKQVKKKKIIISFISTRLAESIF
jgi:hypothetical protein